MALLTLGGWSQDSSGTGSPRVCTCHNSPLGGNEQLLAEVHLEPVGAGGVLPAPPHPHPSPSPSQVPRPGALRGASHLYPHAEELREALTGPPWTCTVKTSRLFEFGFVL